MREINSGSKPDIAVAPIVARLLVRDTHISLDSECTRNVQCAPSTDGVCHAFQRTDLLLQRHSAPADRCLRPAGARLGPGPPDLPGADQAWRDGEGPPR